MNTKHSITADFPPLW